MNIPAIHCDQCGQRVEVFSVLDDHNRSASWWEHVVEPADDHDVTFTNDASTSPDVRSSTGTKGDSL